MGNTAEEHERCHSDVEKVKPCMPNIKPTVSMMHVSGDNSDGIKETVPSEDDQNALDVDKDDSPKTQDSSKPSLQQETPSDCRIDDSINVTIHGEGQVKTNDMIFESNLEAPLHENLKRSGYIKWTPIQKYSIPNIINGRDVFAISQSGSGKTMAYLVPIINNLLTNLTVVSRKVNPMEALVIILSPTNELSLQIHEETKKLTFNTNIKCVVAISNDNYSTQLNTIRNGCHILVSTTSRLLELLERKIVSIKSLRFIVFDEGDKILSDQMFTNLKSLMYPKQGEKALFQTLCFTTTYNLKHKLPAILTNPLYIGAGDINKPPQEIEQFFYNVRHFKPKLDILTQLLNNDYILGDKRHLTIVFSNSVKCILMLAEALVPFKSLLGIVHFKQTPKKNYEAICNFKSGRQPILITHFFLGKGLDFPNVKHVIHFDLPASIECYITQIGRTGRNGNRGRASSFYCSSFDRDLMSQINSMNNKVGLKAADFFVQLSQRMDSIVPRQNLNEDFRSEIGFTTRKKSRSPYRKPRGDVETNCPRAGQNTLQNEAANKTSKHANLNFVHPSKLGRLGCTFRFGPPACLPNGSLATLPSHQKVNLKSGLKCSDHPVNHDSSMSGHTSKPLKPKAFHSPFIGVAFEDNRSNVDEEGDQIFIIPKAFKNPTPPPTPKVIDQGLDVPVWVMKTEYPEIDRSPADLVAQSDRGRAYLMNSARGITRSVMKKLKYRLRLDIHEI